MFFTSFMRFTNIYWVWNTLQKH